MHLPTFPCAFLFLFCPVSHNFTVLHIFLLTPVPDTHTYLDNILSSFSPCKLIFFHQSYIIFRPSHDAAFTLTPLPLTPISPSHLHLHFYFPFVLSHAHLRSPTHTRLSRCICVCSNEGQRADSALLKGNLALLGRQSSDEGHI